MSGFMGRIIGKTERMATVNADVLGEAASFRQEVDEVAGNDADCGMPDFLQAGLKTRLYGGL